MKSIQDDQEFEAKIKKTQLFQPLTFILQNNFKINAVEASAQASIIYNYLDKFLEYNSAEIIIDFLKKPIETYPLLNSQ
jgi:hypothetical protein